MDPKDYYVGGIVGRFQLDIPHEAHMNLIQNTLDNHEHVIIFLGINHVINSFNNPLDYKSRKLMIEEYFDEERDRISILPIKDKETNEEWSADLDSRIEEIHPGRSCLLYGGRDSFMSAYKGKYDMEELVQEIYVSGTDARNAASKKVIKSAEYRIGVIAAAHSRYVPVVPTVDVAIVDETETKVLLAKRNYESGWRFIGGHIDPEDKFAKDAAKREATEETGGSAEIEIIEYIEQVQIEPWKYRGEREGMITTLFKGKHIFGPLNPADDIDMLKWVEINKLKEEGNIIKEHEILRDLFLEHVERIEESI